MGGIIREEMRGNVHLQKQSVAQIFSVPGPGLDKEPIPLAVEIVSYFLGLADLRTRWGVILLVSSH